MAGVVITCSNKSSAPADFFCEVRSAQPFIEG